MNLSIKKISRELKDYQQIKKAYDASFDIEDRISFKILQLLSHRKNVHFLAFYDGDKFCGLTYFILYKDVTFILYLVIDPNLKSKGFGSQILDWIKEQYPKNTFVLYIDEVDQKYEDYAIRLKRLHFYEKNEFALTEYIMQHGKFTYQILVNGGLFVPSKLKILFLRFSFGTNCPRIISIKK